jgi:hypothetical protein
VTPGRNGKGLPGEPFSQSAAPRSLRRIYSFPTRMNEMTRA